MCLLENIDMRVWIGYECGWTNAGEWRNAVKVFDSDYKALVWKEEFEGNYNEWRDYQDFEVE